VVEQLVQFVGAGLCLAAFVLAQLGRLRPTASRYLLANAVGSAVLASAAYAARQWGFLVLELVWAVVSARGLLARRGLD
jgi:hypothetical protein